MKNRIYSGPAVKGLEMKCYCLLLLSVLLHMIWFPLELKGVSATYDSGSYHLLTLVLLYPHIYSFK